MKIIKLTLDGQLPIWITWGPRMTMRTDPSINGTLIGIIENDYNYNIIVTETPQQILDLLADAADI